LPLYAYRCTQCGHRFEKIQNFSAEPELVCPKCGNATLERPLTAPRLHFKGAGWYVNDYAPKSSEPASESSSESGAKADTKSEPGTTSTDTKKPSTASEGSSSAPASAPAPAPPTSTNTTTWF